jgi:5'-nucleotidase
VRILLTNDDGILAPGLAAMYDALTDLGEVIVAAPNSAQSATAHGITVLEAINVRRIQAHNRFHGFAVAGRPADCVKLAIHELVEYKPDLVVSGINDGSNVSINVLYSGTVAAAAEAALLGYPGIAVSLERGREPDFVRAATFARVVINRLIEVGLKPGQLTNINIPDLTAGNPRGIRVAAQALQPMVDRYRRQSVGADVSQYTLDGEFAEIESGHETDLHALSEGFVVVTPLHVDMTERLRLGEMERLAWPDIPFSRP